MSGPAMDGDAHAVVQAGVVHGDVQVAAPVWRPPVPRQLPPEPRVWVDRAAELAMLTEAARDSGWPAVLLYGPAGVGTSSLAVRWGHRTAHRWPGGQISLDLHRAPTAGPALAVGLHALGVPAEAIPAGMASRVGLWRTLTADRPVLTVADGVFHCSVLRALVPGTGAGSLLVATARRALPELAIDTVMPIPVRPLPPDEARTLLLNLLPPHARRRDLAPALARSGGRPLALRLLVGALANSSDTPDPLQSPEKGTDSMADIARTTLDALPEDHRADALLLAVAAPALRITPEAATAIWDTGPCEAADRLERLCACGLAEPREQGAVRMPEQVRDAARAAAAGQVADAAAAARARAVTFYESEATRVSLALMPKRLFYDREWINGHAPADLDAEGAAGWFEAETDALGAVLVHAGATGRHTAVLHLIEALRPWLQRSIALDLWRMAVQAGRAAAAAVGVPVAECLVHNMATALHLRVREMDAALESAHVGMQAARSAGPLYAATSGEMLGAVLTAAGRLTEAIAHHRAAVAAYEQHGEARGTAVQRRQLAAALVAAEELPEGIATARAATRQLEELGEGFHAAKAGLVLGRGLFEAGETEAAEQAARHAFDLGGDYDRAQVRLLLADAAHRRGDNAAEREYLDAALDVLTTLAPTQADAIRTRLDSFR